jgi:hypothetical protein
MAPLNERRVQATGDGGWFDQGRRTPLRLDLGSAAVNKQFDPRNEAGVIRRQKQRHLGNFLRFPHPSHRDRGHNPRKHVGR